MYTYIYIASLISLAPPPPPVLSTFYIFLTSKCNSFIVKEILPSVRKELPLL